MGSAKNTRVLCVAQDAGGASVLGPVVARLLAQGIPSRILAAEPAFGLLSRRLGPASDAEHLGGDAEGICIQIEKSFAEWRPSVLLVGTSHRASPDQWATVQARKWKVPSLALLDSWCNYELRFSGPSASQRLCYVPDVIAVMDEEARTSLLRIGVCDSGIVVTGHPGFDELAGLRKTTPNLRAATAHRLGIDPDGWWVLFVSENGEEVYRQFPDLNPGYTEVDVFDMIGAAMGGVAAQRPVTLIVRRHPGERLAKYPPAGDAPAWLRVDDADNPREIVRCVDTVIGISSVLLLEAFLLGRPVISVQPVPRPEDPFVLTQRGFVPLVRSADEIERVLHAIGGQPPHTSDAMRWISFLLDGQACGRVVSLIEQMGRR